MIWVDAVGGFLTLLHADVLIGQAVPGNHVDLPLLGDLSRQHAVICREGGDYVVRPVADVELAGRWLRGPAPLTDGDELRLGSSCRLRFRQPNPLSATARLEILSRHRTQPSCDGILLLGETCVLGPAEDSHVVCRRWSRPLILLPQGGGTHFRFKADQAVDVDGRPAGDAGDVAWGSRISSEDFALMLERL